MEEKIKKELEELIHNTFQELDNISRDNGKSRLIFPHYHNGEIRISEQELRFLFIEKLIPFLETHTLFYSIETPTNDRYKFSKDKKQIKPKRIHNCTNTNTERFESASFDLVIHRHKQDKNEDRLAIIEFKSKGSMHEYAKDICKLGNKYEGIDTTIRYFIVVVNKTGVSKGKTTEQSVQEMFSNKNQQIDFESFKDDAKINVICYSLELKKEVDHGKYIDLRNIDTNLNNLITPELFLPGESHEK